MATRDSHEWIFTPEEAELFRGAYSLDFGNVMHAALIRRSIDQSKLPRKRTHIPLIAENEMPVVFSDRLLDGVLLELDGPVHDDPERFQNGDSLMHLIHDCKEVLLARQKTN